MPPVLPIDTQRYQSGDFTLEVTAHPSALSQWSDRPVVRQLRFNLWLEQPERQRLATGNQHQLLGISTAIETYVQTHLSQQAWPQTHTLTLLEKPLTLSTLQLFDIAEVFSTYGQEQITLPAPVRQRRLSHWWAGSAVAASLVVAVGSMTAIYRYSAPGGLQEATTAQAPTVLEDRGRTLPEVAIPEADLPEAIAVSPIDRTEVTSVPAPLEPAQSAEAKTPQPALPESTLVPDPAAAISDSLSAPSAPEPSVPLATSAPPAAAKPSSIERLAPSDDPDVAIAEAPAPTIAPQERSGGASRSNNIPGDDSFVADALPGPDLDAANLDAASEETQAMDNGAVAGQVEDEDEILAAIAASFAPYQPMGTPYPLVYHLQVSPDGTVLALEPVSEHASIITIPNEVRVPSPGRFLQVELTYTGAIRPTVKELP